MFLLSDLAPEAYAWKMICLLLGCLILGFGVYTEVMADVVMLPGEPSCGPSCPVAHGLRDHQDRFDVSMAACAAALSFLFAGKLNGVREGTIIAAILVGFIARLIGRKRHFYRKNCFLQRRSPTLCRKRALLAVGFVF